MRRLLAVAALVLTARTVQAEPAQGADQGARQAVADNGAIAPILHFVPSGAATVRATGGWDTASQQPVASADLDVRVWQRLRIVGGAQWADRNGGRLRPYGGAEYAITPGAAVSLVYKPEGFTEPEGEMELGFAFAHRLGPASLVANLAYGQDPEAKERDAEQALGATFRVGPRLWVGAAERARVALASPRAGEPAWDLAVGPHAALDAGSVVLLGFAGAVARSVDSATHTGLSIALGVARAF